MWRAGAQSPTEDARPGPRSHPENRLWRFTTHARSGQRTPPWPGACLRQAQRGSYAALLRATPVQTASGRLGFLRFQRLFRDQRHRLPAGGQPVKVQLLRDFVDKQVQHLERGEVPPSKALVVGSKPLAKLARGTVGQQAAPHPSPLNTASFVPHPKPLPVHLQSKTR